MHNDSTLLVNTEWLADNIGNSQLRVFDATYFLTDKTRDPLQEYLEEHISGTQFFDITTIADTDSPLPNTVPSESIFEAAARSLGVSGDSQIIVYDRLGLFSAARVWWLFRYFGHRQVAVLDGGLPKWLAEKRPVESGEVNFASGDFRAIVNPLMLRSAEAVLSITRDNSEQIVDARAAARFAGTAAEPHPGLRSGHIPGSINLPFQQLLNKDHTFKDATELQRLFSSVGLNDQQPVTTTCGSGVTACIVSLGLALLGRDSAMFDGSWTEWGSREELPIATED